VPPVPAAPYAPAAPHAPVGPAPPRGIATSLAAPAAAPVRLPDWPTYHRDQRRYGYEPTMPRVSGGMRSWWNLRLDGAVYASPLFVNDVAIVATEGGSLYGIRYNRVVWKRHVGPPVPKSLLPCGNIDPLGITGTPVYDRASRTVFAVAEVRNPIRHILVGVDPANGRLRLSRMISPYGAAPKYLQQRGALTLSRGRVWVAFGGLAGDCGPYRGRVLGIHTNGRGPVTSFAVPTTREGGIWTPPGPTVDSYGRLYVSVGNGESFGPRYDYTDSVLLLDGARIRSFFAPTTWPEENRADLDLGSQGPAIVNGYIFIAGKEGTAYTLRPAQLGGIGGQVSKAAICRSFGGTAVVGDVVYVPCADGVRAVRIADDGTMSVLWHADPAIAGSPVVGGGVVWSMDTRGGRLHQLDPRTGASIRSAATGVASRFATPALHGWAVVVGTMTGVRLFLTS
jgi:outer membrane protein assembly factor BamB